jgi:hypothetical protein
MKFKKGDNLVSGTGRKYEFDTYLSRSDFYGVDCVVMYTNEGGRTFAHTAVSARLQLEKPPEFEVGKTYRFRKNKYEVVEVRDDMVLCWATYASGNQGSGLLYQAYRKDYEEVNC